MIGRRALLGLIGIASILSITRVSAQPRRPFRIVGLMLVQQARMQALWRQAIEKYGYVVGETIVAESNYGTPEELPALARELVRTKPDVVVASSSAALRALMSATRAIPVVAIDMETDPVAAGFANSLARPGGNMTGVFLDLPEFSGKRLELLKETLPSVTHVVALWDPAMDRTPLKELIRSADILRVRLTVVEMPNEASINEATRVAVAGRAGAVMVMRSPRLDELSAQIVKHAGEARLPVFGLFANVPGAGGLLSFGPNVEELNARTAWYVDRILKGVPPGDLPIRRPERFDVVVNLKAAKALGIRVPASVLVRANDVIS